MVQDNTQALPGAIAEVLQQALQQPPERVRALSLPGGGRVWLKRVEKAEGRMRLQKGDGAKAFAAERQAMAVLSAAGLAVAAPLAEGPDYVLLPDLGPTLQALMADPDIALSERIAAFTAAGRALGALHQAGFVHGRPALRDLCWQEGQLRMIDLERFRNRKRGPMAQALDMVIFTHSWFARTKGQPIGPELLAALQGWFETAPNSASQALHRLMWLLRPVGALARLVLRFRPQSRDWAAVLATLEALPPSGQLLL